VLTFLGTVSLVAWQYKKKKTAGLLIGLICAIKPQWGILLLWGALRRQWAMVIVGALTLTILIAISAFIYGLHHFVDYLSVLSFLSQRGEAYFPNQSVNGLLNRLFFNGNNLHFADESFPPFNPVIYGSTLISSLLIITTALFWRWRDISNVDAPELAIMMLSMTIASPIAWEHHYGYSVAHFCHYTTSRAVKTSIWKVDKRVLGRNLLPVKSAA